MTDVNIRLLDQSYEEELFKFEIENKDFFAKKFLSKTRSYYNCDDFKIAVRELIEKQKMDSLYMYLLIDKCGEIVGRVNLVSVMRGNLNKAEIGYTIAKKHQGKGYATSAVKFVLDEAINKHKFHKVEAGTSFDNTGSQIVLMKNGFQITGRYNDCICQDGEWTDCIKFEKILA